MTRRIPQIARAITPAKADRVDLDKEIGMGIDSGRLAFGVLAILPKYRLTVPRKRPRSLADRLAHPLCPSELRDFNRQ